MTYQPDAAVTEESKNANDREESKETIRQSDRKVLEKMGTIGH